MTRRRRRRRGAPGRRRSWPQRSASWWCSAWSWPSFFATGGAPSTRSAPATDRCRRRLRPRLLRRARLLRPRPQRRRSPSRSRPCGFRRPRERSRRLGRWRRHPRFRVSGAPAGQAPRGTAPCRRRAQTKRAATSAARVRLPAAKAGMPEWRRCQLLPSRSVRRTMQPGRWRRSFRCRRPSMPALRPPAAMRACARVGCAETTKNHPQLRRKTRVEIRCGRATSEGVDGVRRTGDGRCNE